MQMRYEELHTKAAEHLQKLLPAYRYLAESVKYTVAYMRNKHAVVFLIFILSYVALVFNVFEIANYNNACSRHLPTVAPYCFRFVSLNFYLLIPDITVLLFLWFIIVSSAAKMREKFSPYKEKTFAHLLLVYIIARIASFRPHSNIVLAFMHDHYMEVGEYGSIVILIGFFVAVSFNRFGAKAGKIVAAKEEKAKKGEISTFQKEVLTSIRSSLPPILSDIAYKYPEFSNISHAVKMAVSSDGTKKQIAVPIPNAMTIKNVSFVNTNTVFVELGLITEFINEIGRLNKFDWKLGIEARGNIKAFIDAKWKSSGGKNGLSITIAEETIDFSKTYPYPSLLTHNPQLKNPLDFIVGKEER